MAKVHNAKDCFDAGCESRRRGFWRLSPYDEPRPDYWWFAGFDGVDFRKAEMSQPDFGDDCGFSVKITPDQARAIGMPVPNDVECVMIPPELHRGLTVQPTDEATALHVRESGPTPNGAI